MSIDGDGGKDGPDLSAIGSKRDQDTLRRIIADPESVNPDAEMPAFAKRLTPAELDAISRYLATEGSASGCAKRRRMLRNSPGRRPDYAA